MTTSTRILRGFGVIAMIILASHPAAAGSSESADFTIDLRDAAMLEVSPIGDPQLAGTSFSVTITSKDGGGTVVPYEGTITLDAGFAGVNPGWAWLTAGTAIVSVTLDTPGTDVVLSASGVGLSGASNVFDVTGGLCSASSLTVGVTDHTGAPAGGATVHLSTGSDCVTDGVYGLCSFSPLAPGGYTAWAELGARTSDSIPISVGCNAVTTTITLKGTACNPGGLTPVLLVPGIMGSTTASWSIYPHLTPNPPGPGDWPKWNLKDEGGLLDPAGKAGWRSLVKAFQSVDSAYEVGCTLFPTPFDWRMDAEEAASTYLVPQIAAAKLASGADRVHIVAHSMGGIVTRAYIEGDSFPQPSDIDKFVMVGTPNHGSAMAYFLWGGGDPVVADLVGANVSGSFGSWVVGFYEASAENLYDTHFGERLTFSDYINDPEDYRLKMLDLVRLNAGKGHVPALRLLLPTSGDDFLSNTSDRELRCLPNTRLDDLNSDPDIDRLGAPDDPDPNVVRTIILASKDESTLDAIDVLSDNTSCASTFYPDGHPQATLPLSGAPWTTASGDGTVKLESAGLGLIQKVEEDKGVHSGLIGAYKDNIVYYLTGMLPSKVGESYKLEVSSRLVVSVGGRVQPLVTDPNMLSAGVDPGTGDIVRDIAKSDLDLRGNMAIVVIDDPTTGSYSVELGGAYAEDCVVKVEYIDDTTSASHTYVAYFDGTGFELRFSVDPGDEDRVTIDLVPPPPAGLSAEIVGALTELSWEASSDSLVTGYVVYSQVEGGASLQPLGTTVGTSYATGHSWATNSSATTHLYAVEANYTDGSQSFLSRLVRNNDRDHDGRTDQEEADRGTALDNPDTDDDGLTDGEEEYHGTDPFDPDSDGDGFGDAEEIAAGSDPRDSDSSPLIFIDGFENGDALAWSSTVP